MTDPSLIESLNIPKQILDKTAAFLDRLLGPAVDETGQLIADRVRFRRLKSQVKILARTEELLQGAGLRPAKVELRTLVPLIERASLEENPEIQEMWAKLLANASSEPAKVGLHAVCIDVLSGIGPAEARIMQFIYGDYLARKPEELAKRRKYHRDATDIHAESLSYKPEKLASVANADGAIADLLIDNLLRLGLLRFEVPPVEDGETVYPSYVNLTEMGLAILKECNAAPKAAS